MTAGAAVLALGVCLALLAPLAAVAQGHPRYSRRPMVVQYDVGVTACDGVRLSADGYRPPLAEGLEITGPVTATANFSTDVPDADITVKRLDVQPDGRALNTGSRGPATGTRSSGRSSSSRASCRLDVELFPTANYFAPGHRIRIEVSSSDFPNFARNLNIRGNPNTLTEMRMATTRIHHSAEHPSHTMLRVIPPGTIRRWQPVLAN